MVKQSIKFTEGIINLPASGPVSYNVLSVASRPIDKIKEYWYFSP